MTRIDPRTPCLIGVGARTWHPDDVGEAGAPEPLAMWEQVARDAASDAGLPALVEHLDSVQIVYCQTWQYDDPVDRLAARLGASPRHRYYSGIGGTTPQVLLNDAAAAILAGNLDLVLVTGAEAIATARAFFSRGEPLPFGFAPAEERPFPWEAPFHPSEVAHDIWQAWLTFALFDSARRAHLGIDLDAYRARMGRMLAPMTEIAARNPRAWFRTARSAEEIVTPTAENRMVGYPYTKYTVSAIDVDMAAAVVMASHAMADTLGVPDDRRVYLRGWCYATDPVYVAEHVDLWRSPAMAAAGAEALRVSRLGIDDVAHLDLYSCFASSLNFARDALGLAEDDQRSLTVTGGLPYHGGPASNYITHSVAAMVETLRSDPGSVGVVSGVGMHMTKHVYGVYSTVPGAVILPDAGGVQARLDAGGRCVILDAHEGPATVAAYSVVHGRDGEPEWGLLVCDTPGGGRCYARVVDAGVLAAAEQRELVGSAVEVSPSVVAGPTGQVTVNVATVL